MTALLYTTLILFIIVCIFLILLVLIQKGRGGGLASAFGGMGGNTAFGSKTGDVLTWATSVVFGVFILLAIILNLVANKVNANRTAGAAPVPTPIPAQQNPMTQQPAGVGDSLPNMPTNPPPATNP
ncbi:MAG TPA: preprotein translocase subunit SecG [Tepidisphaeraceae bacterium]|jgi:preprotein translocase subunit SecG|nr:preprotein translocase subunit SecG [Tepidisphaeraceae bacterium]